MNVLKNDKKPLYQDMGKDIPNVMQNEMNDVPKVLKKPNKGLIYETDI